MPENRTEIAKLEAVELVPPLPKDRHPVAVYLASLTPNTRKTMEHSLIVITRILNGDRC